MSSFTPAQRAGVGLLIGISGTSGAGKTPSALRLARGLVADPGEDLRDPAVLERIDRRIYVIDGDAGRSLFYAPGPEEACGPMKFRFNHAPWSDFSPDGLLKLIVEAEKAGARAIVIDSYSYTWDGPGGVVETHDKFCDEDVERQRQKHHNDNRRGAFDEDKAWDRASMQGWKVAKAPHSRLVTRMLQSRAHLIVCMHADDKLRLEQKEESFEKNGRTISYTKTQITPAAQIPVADRWVPICEKKFPRHLSMRLLLTPERPGHPIAQRVHHDHQNWIDEDRPIDEALGVKLAAWASGASTGAPKPVILSHTTPAKAGGGEERRKETPPSDTFPGDFVAFGPARYDPARANKIPLDARVSDDTLRAFATAFAKILEHAPDDAARGAWFDANTDALLVLSARLPRWHAGLRAKEPKTPPGGGVTEGASEGGSRQDAPSSPFDDDESLREMMR